MFQRFCKSARSASRQRENFMESLHSDGSATYLLIIWVEKIIPLTMKSKQIPYPSIVFLSISGVPIRSDTNQSVQSQKVTRGLKFWKKKLDCTIHVVKTKALRLCFRICRLFSDAAAYYISRDCSFCTHHYES